MIILNSGGQTGVDRAALDVAIELGIPYGGWLPRGRLAEDGPLPSLYENMRETDSPRYEARTERNVLDSDATLLLTVGPPSGGTAYTKEVALRAGRPVHEVDLSTADLDSAAIAVRQWLETIPGPSVNVAGPRASLAPTAYNLARRLLLAALRAERRDTRQTERIEGLRH